MHKGPDQATFVIEDNVHTTDVGGHPQYREVDEIKQYLMLDISHLSKQLGAYFHLKLLIVIHLSKCYNFTCQETQYCFQR